MNDKAQGVTAKALGGSPGKAINVLMVRIPACLSLSGVSPKLPLKKSSALIVFDTDSFKLNKKSVSSEPD